MSEAVVDTQAEADALLARLRLIRRKLGLPEGPDRQRLFQERIELFARLRDLDVPASTIAEAFGVSTRAVWDALGKARKGEPSTRRPGS